MLPEGAKSHMPLIALAVVSAAIIFYLYRELQKAKRALVASETASLTIGPPDSRPGALRSHEPRRSRDAAGDDDDESEDEDAEDAEEALNPRIPALQQAAAGRERRVKFAAPDSSTATNRSKSDDDSVDARRGTKRASPDSRQAPSASTPQQRRAFESSE